MEVSDSFHCVWDSEVNLSLCNLLLKQKEIRRKKYIFFKTYISKVSFISHPQYHQML